MLKWKKEKNACRCMCILEFHSSLLDAVSHCHDLWLHDISLQNPFQFARLLAMDLACFAA